MTVSSTASRVVLSGDGTSTAWPFAFKVQQAADLAVVYSDATGSDIALSAGQYDVTGFGQDAGGTVTYPKSGSGNPAIATGTTLTIYRKVAVTQPTSISNQGAMWPQVIEAALDRLTYIGQAVTDAISRSLVIGPTDGGTLAPLPNAATRANAALLFDAEGQPYAGALVPGTVGTAAWLLQNFFAQATSAPAARAALGAIALADVGAGATVAAAGSYALPNGLILKWGTSGSIASAGNAVQTFPAAFPNGFFGALLTPLANSTGHADTGGAASFKIHNNGAGAATYFWLALGS